MSLTKIASEDPHSPARKAGVRPGETLTHINGHPIVDVLDYKFYTYDPRLTLTLEDQAKLARDNAKKMEQGKIEVMKVVEGVQGSEKLAELIERGKKKGSLSSSELMDVLEDMDLESDQMDKIYDTLENLGIDTVGEDYIPDLPDDADPPLEAMEDISEEEIVDPNTLVDSFSIDDPVRMYLKEIGKVNLLTPDEEVQLAQDMGAGDAAKEQLAELEEQVREGQDALRENERLQSLLGVAQEHPDWTYASATVIQRSTTNWANQITISVGSGQEVEAGDCVIDQYGNLVGVVKEVGTNWALVDTLLDPGMELGVRVARTDDSAMAQGDFTLMGEGKLRMTYIPQDAQLISGDQVTTSGLGGKYPGGLLVGQVESIETEADGISRSAVLRPSADVEDIRYVYVITNFEG